MLHTISYMIEVTEETPLQVGTSNILVGNTQTGFCFLTTTNYRGYKTNSVPMVVGFQGLSLGLQSHVTFM